ncbi:hypothetical protein CLOM_g5119 [Closterium sp. NIES-68]|nr:hypothetical protein CLOM_g5119 [Closterium sp. NIES-68]GJP79636.1 hypothetical protein CLOP_g9845 [Closterium sp. NIES-67]
MLGAAMAVTASTSPLPRGAHHRRVWSLFCCSDPATRSFYELDVDAESSARGDAEAAAAGAEQPADTARQVRRDGDDGALLRGLADIAASEKALRAEVAAREAQPPLTSTNAPIDHGASDVSSSVSTSAPQSAFSAACSPLQALSPRPELAASGGATSSAGIMDMWKNLEAPASPKHNSAAARKSRVAHSADAAFPPFHRAPVRVDVPHSPANLPDSAVSPTNSEGSVARTPGGTYLSFSSAPSPRTVQCAYSLQTGALIVTPNPRGSAGWAAVGGNGGSGGAWGSERALSPPEEAGGAGGVVGWEQEVRRWEEEEERERLEGEVRGMVAHLMGQLRAVRGAAHQMAEALSADVAEGSGESEIGTGTGCSGGAAEMAAVSAAARAVRLLVKSSDANRSIMAAVPGAIGALVGVADALLLAESGGTRGAEGAAEAESSECGERSGGERVEGEADRGQDGGWKEGGGSEAMAQRRKEGEAEKAAEAAREAVGHAVTALLNLSLSPGTHAAMAGEGAVDALSRIVACAEGRGGSTGEGRRGTTGEGRGGTTGEGGACSGAGDELPRAPGRPSLVSQEARENAAAALFMLTSSPLPPSLSSVHSTSLSSSTSSLAGALSSSSPPASSFPPQHKPALTSNHASNPNPTHTDPPSTALNPSASDLASIRRRVAASPGVIAGLVRMLPASPARSLRGRKDAALTLFNLALCADHRPAVIAAGAVCPLVRMLEEEEPGMRLGLEEKAVAVLARLAQATEGSRQIRACGGIPPLVELLDASCAALGASPSMASLAELSVQTGEGAGGGGGGSGGSGAGEQQRWRRVQKDVGAVLLRAVEDEGARREMLEEGALPVLRKMRHRGSTRARLTANQLLDALQNKTAQKSEGEA